MRIVEIEMGAQVVSDDGHILAVFPDVQTAEIVMASWPMAKLSKREEVKPMSVMDGLRLAWRWGKP